VANLVRILLLQPFSLKSFRDNSDHLSQITTPCHLKVADYVQHFVQHSSREAHPVRCFSYQLIQLPCSDDTREIVVLCCCEEHSTGQQTSRKFLESAAHVICAALYAVSRHQHSLPRDDSRLTLVDSHTFRPSNQFLPGSSNQFLPGSVVDMHWRQLLLFLASICERSVWITS